MVLAASAAVFVVGLAVGHFLLPIGLAIFVVAIVGWVYEYYRGHFARGRSAVSRRPPDSSGGLLRVWSDPEIQARVRMRATPVSGSTGR